MDDRVLSVQSHVAFGYVGGKAAVFALEAIGYEVDVSPSQKFTNNTRPTVSQVVNTVNFSNHSGEGYTTSRIF